MALGGTLSRLGRSEEARTAYDSALALAPGSAAALTGRGLLDLRAGDPEGATQAFEAALAADPAHRQALYNLAAALTLLGRHEEAAAARRRFAETSESEGVRARSLARTRVRGPGW